MPRLGSRLRALALLALLAAPLGAQQPFTLDQFRRIVGVGGVELAPDGRAVVVTVTRRNYEANKNESELYLVEAATGTARQLTTDRRTVGQARFSQDGSMLAFLAA